MWRELKQSMRELVSDEPGRRFARFHIRRKRDDERYVTSVAYVIGGIAIVAVGIVLSVSPIVPGFFLVIAGLGIDRLGKERWGLATVGAVALAFTPALSGHAASTPGYAFIAVVSDAVHVIGASGWLGSLLIVVIVGIPAAMRLERDQQGAAVANLVNAFSPTALTFAGITVVTGVFAALLHVGTIPNLWETQYGRTLLIKLGVLSAVALTGAYNWLRVRPALGSPQSARRLKRSATVELAIAALVLAVTAVLVATPTPMDEAMMQNVSPSSSPDNMSR